MADRPITPQQLRALWASARAKGMDEDTLRALVKSETGSDSIKALSTAQAAAVLKRLGGSSPRSSDGRGAKGEGHRRFADMANRPGMATDKQLRKIEAMWRERSKEATTDAQDVALAQWLDGRFHVSAMRFLTRSRASHVIKVLEKMEVIRAAS